MGNIKQSDYFMRVETIYNKYKADGELLNKYPDLASFKQEHERMFAKLFVVMCANFFELYTLEFLPNLLSDKEITRNFLSRQALNRKYHTLFTWGKKDKEDKYKKGSINSFLSLFGDEFKQDIEKKIGGDVYLTDAYSKINSFLQLGTLRNTLVHEGFDEEIIKEEGNSNKNFYNYSSIEDVWLHFSKACDFYEYILDEIRCEIKYANCPITDYCI